MPSTITVPDEALAELKPIFSAVEGSCEVWTDEEVVTRILIRGLMAYGQSAGRDFSEMSQVAARVRAAIAGTGAEAATG